ncbi:NmrA family NAD(P)-binding protein [Mycobacterium innocens]|uniref:NmrA family NAD(P)-binding protein n=1 Tax=Mycobacterium innocens TaxID=2341083 RepID=UPI0009E5AC2F
MTRTRVLVTGATGRIGGAVATQLLGRGVSTRALVHRHDQRSARLQALGADVVVADMFDIQQVQSVVDGVDRLYFNPPYHPHALDSAVAFAVAARRAGVEAVVVFGAVAGQPRTSGAVHPAGLVDSRVVRAAAGYRTRRGRSRILRRQLPPAGPAGRPTRRATGADRKRPKCAALQRRYRARCGRSVA